MSQTFSFTPDANGSWRIDADVTDSDTNAATTVQRTITVTGGAGNTAPSPVGSIPNQSVSGGGVGDFVFNLSTVFSDAEEASTALTFSFVNACTCSFDNISIDQGTDELTIDYGNGNPGNNGDGDITITATDAGGLTAVQVFNVIDG